MSGLAVAYWQKVFDENLPSIEKILHEKLDRLDKLHNVPMESLSDWQFQQMKNLEDETKSFIAFLEINKKTQKSYLVETTSIANCQLKLWTENQQLSIENQQFKQELAEKDFLNDVLIK